MKKNRKYQIEKRILELEEEIGSPSSTYRADAYNKNLLTEKAKLEQERKFILDDRDGLKYKIILLVLGALIALVVQNAPRLVMLVYKNFKPTNITIPAVVTPKVGLVVENVHADDIVSSPLKITGYVNGDNWIGFEGQVGTVIFYDAGADVLDTGTLTAVTDWMTSTVRFETTLVFEPRGTVATLEFKNENPSGEPSMDRMVSIPVRLNPSPEHTDDLNY